MHRSDHSQLSFPTSDKGVVFTSGVGIDLPVLVDRNTVTPDRTQDTRVCKHTSDGGPLDKGLLPQSKTTAEKKKLVPLPGLSGW